MLFGPQEQRIRSKESTEVEFQLVSDHSDAHLSPAQTVKDFTSYTYNLIPLSRSDNIFV